MDATIWKTDEETGEIIYLRGVYNAETGENELAMNLRPRQQKSTFKIGNVVSKDQPAKKSHYNEQWRPQHAPTTSSTAVLFLLPTTIFFYPILACLVVCLESVIHYWAHRKNRKMKDQNKYYQSPLHIICKEFCTSCKEEESLQKITKLQEQRADRIKKYGLEYVRRIVT